MDEQQLRVIIRERCGFSAYPQDHMVDSIIIEDIASREGVSVSLVQEAYQSVKVERKQELDDILSGYFDD